MKTVEHKDLKSCKRCGGKVVEQRSTLYLSEALCVECGESWGLYEYEDKDKVSKWNNSNNKERKITVTFSVFCSDDQARNLKVDIERELRGVENIKYVES